MAVNRLAGLLAALPGAPAFVAVPPHAVTVPLGPEAADEGVTCLHDVEAEVLAGPWLLRIRVNVDDWGPGSPPALPMLAVRHADAAGGHGAATEAEGGWMLDASADDLAALAEGLHEVAALLRSPEFAGGA